MVFQIEHNCQKVIIYVKILLNKKKFKTYYMLNIYKFLGKNISLWLVYVTTTDTDIQYNYGKLKHG